MDLKDSTYLEPLSTFKKKFLETMEYPFTHALVVWCPSGHVNPDYVASVLGKRDRKVILHNHWVSSSVSSTLKVWCGAVAEYSCKTYARVAAEELRRESRSLKVFMFKELINILLTAQYNHPKPREETTTLVIKAPNLFQEDAHIFLLRETLMEFGRPSSIRLFPFRTHLGVVAKVEYPTQFQAYVAKTAMHGMLFDCLGTIEVEVDVSQSGRTFHRFVKNCLREILYDD